MSSGGSGEPHVIMVVLPRKSMPVLFIDRQTSKLLMYTWYSGKGLEEGMYTSPEDIARTLVRLAFKGPVQPNIEVDLATLYRMVEPYLYVDLPYEVKARDVRRVVRAITKELRRTG